MLGIVIGIASVILLTSIGEGSRRFILSEFTQFGSNLLQVTPGRQKTTGPAGVFGGTINPLSLDDAEVLRRVPGVERLVPVIGGTARVEAGEKGRSVFVYGVNADMPAVWKFGVRQGRFLPEGDMRRGSAVCVLGSLLKHEIFGDANALGEYVRIGGERRRVVGVMASKGYMVGMNIDDIAYIPVSSAMTLFNRDDLMEIDVVFSNTASAEAISERIRRALKERHRGEEDFTIVTQAEMLSSMDKIIRVVEVAIGAIGGISLVVGAIGIMTMMWISVNERTAEIGLAKAIGATDRQILALFLAEAAFLSTLGGVIGILTGYGIAYLIQLFVPKLPLATPVEFTLAALAVSILVGLASGVGPAYRAARLDPVEALAVE